MKTTEGLTDVGAKLGDLRFVMSKIAPDRKGDQAPLTPQDRVRRAFVLQASLGFDAREIKHQAAHQQDRLMTHHKVLRERDAPWLEDLKAFFPELMSLLRIHDPSLAAEFGSARVGESLDEELQLVQGLVRSIEAVLSGARTPGGMADACDRLIALSRSLFPLFSRAKDSLGIKRAEGSI